VASGSTSARWIAASAAAFLVALAIAGPARGDTFRVNRAGDPAPGACTAGHCTLREAVLAANNASAGRDTVLLPKRRGRYELAIANASSVNEDGALTGDLDVTNAALVVEHRGKGLATVDGNGLDRVFHAFEPLTLRRIKVTGGDSTGNSSQDGGGGILVQSRLAVESSRIAANVGDHGGGIHGTDVSRVRIVRSQLSGNRDTDAGAGLFMAGGTATISRSAIVRNRMDNDSEAAGISLSGAMLTLTRSTVAGNRSEREAGGIGATNSQLAIRGSTISGNSAISTSASPGSGGGLYLFGGEATVVNSTVASNRASADGGGISVVEDADLTMNGVTVARNVANTDDTPVSETGGGLANDSFGALVVDNSLVVLNRLGPGPRNDCTGNPTQSGGGNLLSSLGPSAVCQGFDAAGDAVRSNPGIGTLARNGGPTKTIALRRDSPAIGRARGDAPGRDQRGDRRDRRPDSGAFER
jgi:CSLREA domain-containing protein